MFGWTWAIKTSITHHFQWITHLKTWRIEVIGLALMFSPLLLVLPILIKVQRRLIGPKVIAAEKAEEKRRREEEAAAIGWRIPRSAEAADWRKILLTVVCFYIATFVAVLAFGGLGLLLDRLIPSHARTPRDLTPVQAALLCASLFSATMLGLWILMVFVLPRQRVVLVSDGLIAGLTRTPIPYVLIQNVRIVRSPRRPSLQCFAILATDQHGQRLRHFEFDAEAPIPEIIAAFQSKGLTVETHDESSKRKKGDSE